MTNEPINVLHAVCFSHPYGVQRSILSTANGLKGTDFRVSVAAPPDPVFESMLRDAGVEFHPVPMTSLHDIASARLLARIMKENDIHILHTHLGISSFLGLLAARMAGNIPVVVSRHFLNDRYTTIENPALRSIYLAMYRWMNRRFARIIGVSEAVRDAVVSREGAAAEKCRVVPNGVALGEMRIVGPEEKALIRRELGVPVGARLAITLSRLCPEKDLETLLRATPAVLDCVPEAFFVVLGHGPMSEELTELSQRLGVGKSVLFAGYRADASELLPAGDIFVLPAYEEPFGISLLEAMAAGLPAVAAAAAGPMEILRLGEDGLLFEPRNSSSLAEQLIRLLTRDDVRADFALRSRRRALEFEESRVAAIMESVYREILK